MIAITTAATQANKNALIGTDSLFFAVTFVFYSFFISDRPKRDAGGIARFMVPRRFGQRPN
jgi:hypothetical protein